MKQFEFRGVGVALVTPFKKDSSVDFEALDKLVNSVIDGGVDYLVVNGTTGEASTIELYEKQEILSFVKEINKGRLPIMYGIGANNTAYVQKLIDKTDFKDIQGILTVCPYYNKPSQAGIVRHYSVIADHSPVPVYMYNVPGRTGSNMQADTTLILAQHPNILGIKEASGDIQQCIQIIKHKPQEFHLISGDDMMTVPMVSIGAEGAISVLANAFPDRFTQGIHAALEGRFSDATAITAGFIELNDLLYEESNPVGIKTVLQMMNICEDSVRLPLIHASEPLRQKIHSALSRLLV